MKIQLLTNSIFLLSVVPLALCASQAPTPTIDFSSRSLRELVEYQRNNPIEALSPRSKESYANRFRDLSNQALNDLRVQLGITPEMMAPGQRPTAVVFIVPAAAGVAGPGHVGGHTDRPHGPNCICHLLAQFLSRQGASDNANHEDMTTEVAPEDEEPTTDELNVHMKNMNFKKEQ